MSSNLPPGVTGNEWAIAGPAYERDETRTCGQEEVTLRVLPDLGRTYLAKALEMLDGGEDPKTAAYYLRMARNEVEETTVPECPVVDTEVTVWGGDDGLLHWTCPVCGFEHEEEPS